MTDAQLNEVSVQSQAGDLPYPFFRMHTILRDARSLLGKDVVSHASPLAT